MLIYISGPYSAPTEEGRLENVQAAMRTGIEVMRLGHTAVIPHLTHYTDEYAKSQGIEITWQQWMQQDLEILRRCDALLYLGSSPGADMELAAAIEQEGMLVFYDVNHILVGDK